MVANERWYRMSRTAVREFEEALTKGAMAEAERPREVRRVMCEAIRSQLEDLRVELVAAIGRASLPNLEIKGVCNGRP